MASEVYKKQPNESDQAYRTRLQDELWAKAQKKDFAEHLEKLANRNKLASAGMKIYKALKDFAIYLGKQLGIYNRKEWSKLTLPELIDRTNKALSSDRFLREVEKIEQNKESEEASQRNVRLMFLTNSDLDADGKPKPKVLREIAIEKARIKAEAQANGTWLKAPNGKKSNLTEEQWVAVRTDLKIGLGIGNWLERQSLF